MKTKFLFFSLFCFLFAIPLNAQETDKSKKFSLRVEGGTQITNLAEIIVLYEPKSKIGFTAGIFGEYNFTKNLSLHLGGTYDRRSFELYNYRALGDTNSYYIYQVDYNLNYLTIPLMLKYEAGSSKVKVFVQGGFYVSFLMNATRKGIENYYIDGEGDTDISGTILHYGKNEFVHNGASEGFEWVDINSETSQPENPNYKGYRFMPSDLGFDVSLGLLYQPSRSFGITFGPGFLISLPTVFVDAPDDYKWQQIIKVNIGLIYTIHKK